MTDHTHQPTYLKNAAVHPTITAEQISLLVESFYERVRKNPVLGPVFEENMSRSWEFHMMKMKSFWRSVLLKTGEYKGKPVPVHQRIEGLETDDFNEWLQLFSKTSAEIFDPQAVPLVNEIAQRIATSLWLSRSQDPFISAPNWSANSLPDNHTENSNNRRSR